LAEQRHFSVKHFLGANPVSKENEAEFDWSIAYPCEEVRLANGALLRVYPIAVAHLQQFRAETKEAMEKMLAVMGAAGKEATPAMIRAALSREIVPLLVGKGFALLSACCKPSLEGAPLPVIPLAAEACLRQTFSEGCLLPFVRAADAMASAIVGRSATASELCLRILSQVAIRLKLSSTGASAGSEGAAFPIADIPSPSSSSGATAGGAMPPPT
jgi:hypothetical protein